jgi:tetratricopeptide (TPR) repeat protein
VAVTTPGGAAVARVGAGQSTRVGPAVAVAHGTPTEPLAVPLPESAPRLAMAPVRPSGSRPGTTQPIATARADAARPATAAGQPIERARALLSEGRDEEAIALLLAMTPEPGPARARVQALLGDALRLARHPDEARQAYERALSDGTDATLSWVLADLARLESDLGRAAAAAAVWRRYLAAVPAGPHAPRALWEVARLDETEGRLAAAAEGWTRILADFPRSTLAPAAFARIGRTFLDTRQWEAAVAHFQSRVADADPAFAEAAMVGLMRARLGQGRGDDVRALVREYDARFPAGSRRDEVRRLSGALPDRPRGGR